jgi:hypothetical protein
VTSPSITAAAVEPARAAHDEHHGETAVVQRRLRAREGDAVVRGEHDERLLGEAELVEPLEDRADALVERRALDLKAAMSRRVSGSSGRLAGGRDCSASRTDDGAKKSRCVSKKPTERKNGLGGCDASSSSAIGATALTWVVAP